MDNRFDVELKQFVDAARPFLPPEMIAKLCDGLLEWQKLIQWRERARLLQILNAAMDLGALDDGLDLACRTSLPPETAIIALSARSASGSCGRPS